jgi:hypothetical protein
MEFVNKKWININEYAAYQWFNEIKVLSAYQRFSEIEDLSVYQ